MPRGERSQAWFPEVVRVLSGRAILLALRRFGIESEEAVRELDKAWAKHRALHQLNLYGRPADDRGATPHVHAEEPA